MKSQNAKLPCQMDKWINGYFYDNNLNQPGDSCFELISYEV